MPVDDRDLTVPHGLALRHLFVHLAIEEGTEGDLLAADILGAFVQLQELPLDPSGGRLSRSDRLLRRRSGSCGPPATLDDVIAELPSKSAGTLDPANGPVLIALTGTLHGNYPPWRRGSIS
jgi:hypothetical protein